MRNTFISNSFGSFDENALTSRNTYKKEEKTTYEPWGWRMRHLAHSRFDFLSVYGISYDYNADIFDPDSYFANNLNTFRSKMRDLRRAVVDYSLWETNVNDDYDIIRRKGYAIVSKDTVPSKGSPIASNYAYGWKTGWSYPEDERYHDFITKFNSEFSANIGGINPTTGYMAFSNCAADGTIYYNNSPWTGSSIIEDPRVLENGCVALEELEIIFAALDRFIGMWRIDKNGVYGMSFRPNDPPPYSHGPPEPEKTYFRRGVSGGKNGSFVGGLTATVEEAFQEHDRYPGHYSERRPAPGPAWNDNSEAGNLGNEYASANYGTNWGLPNKPGELTSGWAYYYEKVKRWFRAYYTDAHYQRDFQFVIWTIARKHWNEYSDFGLGLPQDTLTMLFEKTNMSSDNTPIPQSNWTNYLLPVNLDSNTNWGQSNGSIGYVLDGYYTFQELKLKLKSKVGLKQHDKYIATDCPYCLFPSWINEGQTTPRTSILRTRSHPYGYTDWETDKVIEFKLLPWIDPISSMSPPAPKVIFQSLNVTTGTAISDPPISSTIEHQVPTSFKIISTVGLDKNTDVNNKTLKTYAYMRIYEGFTFLQRNIGFITYDTAEFYVQYSEIDLSIESINRTDDISPQPVEVRSYTNKGRINYTVEILTGSFFILSKNGDDIAYIGDPIDDTFNIIFNNGLSSGTYTGSIRLKFRSGHVTNGIHFTEASYDGYYFDIPITLTIT